MKIDLFMVTEAEMDILDAVWDSPVPYSAKALAVIISRRRNRPVKNSSVHALCARLIEKGFMTFVQIDGRNIYLPLIGREDYQFAVAKLFVQILFDGSTEALFASLLNDMDMRAETLCAIQEMVKKAELPCEIWKPLTENARTGEPSAPEDDTCEEWTPIEETGEGQRKRRQKTDRNILWGNSFILIQYKKETEKTANPVQRKLYAPCGIKNA